MSPVLALTTVAWLLACETQASAEVAEIEGQPAAAADLRAIELDDDVKLLQVKMTKVVRTLSGSEAPPAEDHHADMPQAGTSLAGASRRTVLGPLEAMLKWRRPVAGLGVPGVGLAGDFRVVWVTVIALVAVFIKARRGDAAGGPGEPPSSAELENFSPKSLKQRAAAESGPPCRAPEDKTEEAPPPELAKVPLPSRRLRHIGASFVIPYERIRSCSSEVFSFDVPMLPCVWPLHAVLSRSAGADGWEKIELTVDIIKASGLPPLLSCTLPADSQEGREATGGTGCSAEAAEAGARDGSCGGSVGVFRHRRLELCGGNGSAAASMTVYRDGSAVTQRPDGSTWDIESHFDEGKPSMTVLRHGREICQAASLSNGSEDYLQVDTQADTQSPESALLLMCLIAILACYAR